MDADTLLRTWLAGSTLRPSTRAEYAREVGSFLDWCLTQSPPVDALTARPRDIATWARTVHLAPFLPPDLQHGGDILTHLADHHPDVARSHDRRISALAGYYQAAADHRLITLPPQLTNLRTGLPRGNEAKNKLTQMERAVLFSVIGAWSPQQSTHHHRDQLCIYLLLEGLRPAEVIRIDTRHLYPQPDRTVEVRAPDAHENVGSQFVLNALTAAALAAYRAVRPEPADPDEHRLLLNRDRRGLQSRWPNKLVGQMTALHPLLADRQPPVTADTIAHTGFWDTPQPAT